MRLVVDPGVFVSALLSERGPPDALVRLWADGAFELVVSPALLGELRSVLARPHLIERIPQARAHAFVRALSIGSIGADDPPAPPAHTRDPKDDYLVALARAAGADLIVSGDRDLLEADARPPVISPRELLELIQPS